MALEEDLMAELLAECPRVIVGTAPYGTAMPYVTWQHIGGDVLRYTDNAPADKRNVLIQVNTWGATPKGAHVLILLIQERLCASAALQVTPHGEAIGAYDDAGVVSGYLQTFSILGAR